MDDHLREGADMPKGIYERRPKPPCTVEGCTRLNAGYGLCGSHLWRLKHWGDPRPDLPLTPTVEWRFWSKVDASGGIDACWLWLASHGAEGHGQMQYQGRLVAAHRIAWMWRVGPIPEGLVLDHVVCQNPPCVNPRHLEPVTQRINVLRGESPMAKQARQTHCIRGHEFTEENTYHSPSQPNHRRCRICGKEADRNRYRGRDLS